jgi:hypothetical protein
MTAPEKKINPGKVFDLTLRLDQVAQGYRALAERREIKRLLPRNGRKVLRTNSHFSAARSICIGLSRGEQTGVHT